MGIYRKLIIERLLETSVVGQLTSGEPIMCSKCNTAYASDSEYMVHYNEKHKPEEEEKVEKSSYSTDHSETIGPASKADVSPNTPRADEDGLQSTT